jgi:hypothetical protein
MKEELNIASRNNRVLVPQARQRLDRFKAEVTSEVGITNYESVGK